jgi:hypothetical protein
MNYEQAGAAYLATEAELAKADAAHKEATAPLKEKLALLEQWLTTKAQEDGLENVKTAAGTVYWSVHHKATVAAREPFFAHCRETGAWDLLEARAAKTAVKSYVDAHGVPPPGVDYSSVRVFNFRKSAAKDKEK